jgi:hypothetical protein
LRHACLAQQLQHLLRKPLPVAAAPHMTP